MTAPDLLVRSYGGSPQLAVRDAHDLARIDAVDPARWAATSAPTAGLHCDPVFLQHVDGHSKGRLRVSELLAARDWAFARLADRQGIGRRSDVLRLADLDRGAEPGQRLHRAAGRVLEQLQASDRERVSLAQVRAFRGARDRALANGDGVVPPELVGDPELAGFLREALGVVGSTPDRSGHPGLDAALLERFRAGGREWLAWRARPEADPAILPWGEDTAAAAELVAELDPRIDDYLWRCELLRHHGGASPRPAEAELQALQAGGRSAVLDHLADAPLAAPGPEVRLDLDGQLNPVYREALGRLRREVLARALGGEAAVVDRAGWARVRALFAPYEAWRRARPAEPWDKLGPERLAAILEGPLPDRALAAIGEDAAAAEDLAQVDELERLILHQRWLLDLANNLVNFSALYHPEVPALVEAGSLIVDGRRLDFCVRVADRAAHKALAAESMIFLVYAAIGERDQPGGTAFEVVAPVTRGEQGRLRPGKRGLFIDLEGREWDATVVDLVVHPISLIEAVKAPFRRAARFVSKKVEDLAGSRLASAEGDAQGALGRTVDRPPAPAAAPGAVPAPAVTPAPGAAAPAEAKPAAGGGLQSMLLIGSVAFAAVGSALTYLLRTVAEFQLTSVLAGVVGLIAAIVAFSALLSLFKLRRRDLSVVLEASGWAVNAPVRVTRRMGGLFTRTPAFPKGARREVFEPGPEVEEDEEVIARRRRRWRVGWALLFLGGLALGGWLSTSPVWRARVEGWLQRLRD